MYKYIYIYIYTYVYTYIHHLNLVHANSFEKRATSLMFD